MIEDDPQTWSGDTPTPSASTSGSSASTLTVDEPAFLSRCDVGEAFELTYWSAIRKYWEQDFEDDCDIPLEPKHGENDGEDDGEDDSEEISLDAFELVNVSLDDDSDFKAATDVPPDHGITQRIRRWWGSNVSMIIPEDQEIRDHFCRPQLFPIRWATEKYVLTLAFRNAPALEKTYLAYFRTAMSLAMSSAMLSQFYIFSTPTSDPHPLDFRDVGKPLACACLGIAVIVNVIGAARFHRAQEALLNGKVLIGGADLMLVGALIGMVSVFTVPRELPHIPEIC